jgi:magnesium chelatase family protein
MDVLDIDVQVHLANGVPGFQIVGLADKAVAESRERVRSALHAIGMALPPKRITVNLSPADVPKEGNHFDLPIALGLLVGMGVIPQGAIDTYYAMGELALDGLLTPVSGILPAAVHANAQGCGLICPEGNGSEAAWAGELSILAPDSLVALTNHILQRQRLSPPRPMAQDASKPRGDWRDVRGQESAKRVMEIAASGGHNVLLSGPPGAGKSLLASRMTTILPPLSPEEALEVSMIHSIAGQLKEGMLIMERPYRDPHHSASIPALVGGGIRAKPGEISLAHQGILFLDELPEFQRAALDSLRQPLETGYTTVSRANAHVTYPANIQLVAAMNPCRCGYLTDVERACSRAPACGEDYTRRLSGPLLDRIDLRLDVEPVKPYELSRIAAGEDSATVRARVTRTRDIQRQRYTPYQKKLNAEIDGDLLYDQTALDSQSETFLQNAAEKLRLSARGYNRVLRVARTIADMAESQRIDMIHLKEALSYRQG